MNEVVVGVLAFLGAAIGSVLAFWATRTQVRAEREARRREEWGRRFSDALTAVTSGDRVSRATGRALLRELLTSALATDDDRRMAEAVLDAAATGRANPHLLLPSSGDVDDVTVVRDTGDAPPEPHEGAPR